MLIHVFSNGRKVSVKGNQLFIHTGEQDAYLRIKERGRNSHLDRTIALFQVWDSVVEDEYLHSSENYEEAHEEQAEERPRRRLNIPNE